MEVLTAAAGAAEFAAAAFCDACAAGAEAAVSCACCAAGFGIKNMLYPKSIMPESTMNIISLEFLSFICPPKIVLPF
ncbi:MAG: hypothetical protein BWY84_00629 [Candidatus Aerophobetes bacterium ADurb.Bin490]|nr:MAG: hypothetical protein BWY84_00629 [Candidatus Aerophobetes bacterium ADurb.Bin490]